MSTVTITARPAAGAGPAGAPPNAFVLAGGTALGALRAGMVRALYERGIVPDLLAGTSAGALNAAFPASRPTVATAGDLAAIWKDCFGLDRCQARSTPRSSAMPCW